MFVMKSAMLGIKKRRLGLNSKGQSIVELGLMLPMIVLMVGGLLDVAVAFWLGLSTQNAVREAARLAVRTPGLSADDPNIISAVQQRLPGLARYSVLTVGNTGPSDGSCEAQVTVTADGQYFFYILPLIGIDDVRIFRTSTMRYQYNDPPLCNS